MAWVKLAWLTAPFLKRWRAEECLAPYHHIRCPASGLFFIGGGGRPSRKTPPAGPSRTAEDRDGDRCRRRQQFRAGASRGSRLLRLAPFSGRRSCSPARISPAGRSTRGTAPTCMARSRTFKRLTAWPASGIVDEATWKDPERRHGAGSRSRGDRARGRRRPLHAGPRGHDGESEAPGALLLARRSRRSPRSTTPVPLCCRSSIRARALTGGRGDPGAQRPIVAPPGKPASIVVSKSRHSVTALDAEGKVLSRYPATSGSEHDPLPIGKWKILGVGRRTLPFTTIRTSSGTRRATDGKALIAPGPNNPVGVAWIDLSKEHYGIHGTPEPSQVGKTQSHGCIRLTNWDVTELSKMVGPGTPAILEE